MIETTDLTKQFDGYAAVDRLTLTIEEGEVFGFLGPNGAGKTTTVRMLTSLIAPTHGSAKVLNYRVGTDDQQIRRNVGILTETPGLYDRLSAWRNLVIYARLYEVDDAEKQVEKGKMPLRSYLLLHPDARLSESDRKILLEWATGP